jgi:hypothetical protein
LATTGTELGTDVLLALSGHLSRAQQCLLLGVKRTSHGVHINKPTGRVCPGAPTIPRWRTERLSLIFPKTFEPILCQRSIPGGVLDIPVSQVGLECAGIVTIIRELVTTSVAKHVGVGLYSQLRGKRGILEESNTGHLARGGTNRRPRSRAFRTQNRASVSWIREGNFRPRVVGNTQAPRSQACEHTEYICSE